MSLSPHIQTERRVGNGASRPTCSPGFTLLEVMLALAVSAIVLAAIGGVFYSAIRLRERTTAALDAVAPLHLALDLLRRDLRGTVASGGEMAGEFTSPAGGGALAQNSSIRFRTSTGTLKEDAPWADIQEVTYELRPSAQRGRSPGQDLFRSVNRNVLSSMGQDLDDQWLMGNIASLEFACYDGASWRDSWDTSSSNTNLPSAIRVRIQLADSASAVARNPEPYEMVIPLVSQSRTNQSQSVGGGQ
jgi:general secretion pathway protein J